MNLFGVEIGMLFTTVVLSLPIIYWFLTRHFNYWKKLGINGPRPLPIFGNMLTTMFTNLTATERKLYQLYGNKYGTFMGNKPVLTVADPQLIKQIMVKDFHNFRNRRESPVIHEILSKHMFFARDDQWKRLRSIASPTFTSGKMKKMYPLINQCNNDCLEHVEMYAKSGDEANMKDLFGNFTMNVIAKCAFATNVNAHKDPNNPFVTNAKEIFNFNTWKILMIFLFPKFINKFLGNKSAANESSNEFFFNVTRHVMKKRRDNNEKHNDFLQLLMDTEKDDNISEEKINDHESHHVNEGAEELEAEKNALNIKLTKKKLDDNEIMAQSWLFFIAGFETTASTLTFCSYELALNPECQEKLHDEVKTAIDSNGNIDYETLSKLPYLDAVLSETLRMYPPVMKLEREVMIDYTLDGIQLEKGQLIEIPAYAIHYNKEYHPNPETFNPERFLPENRHLIQPYTYLPFGTGPRNCIGMRFALLEAKLNLSKIMLKYKFVRCPNTDVPLQMIPGRRIVGAKRVILRIEKR